MYRFRKRITAPALVLALCPWLWLESAHAAVVMSIGHNFTGISYGGSNTNSASLPADCNGAVGPNHFVEFVNGVFAVYNKTNGSQEDFKTDVDFWAAAHVGIDSLWEVSDPRVIYDPTSQRWFASQVDIDVFTQ